jgi:hypothetical protein
MIRKLSILLLASAALLLPAPLKAQTNSAPGPIVSINTSNVVPTLQGIGMDLLDQLSYATNWAVAPFMIYDEGSHQFGGGLAGIYNITPALGAMIRLDYLNQEVWMPSASLQFQAPITIASNVTVIPFGFTGIATPLGGAGKNNGTAVGMFGAGVDLSFPKLSKHYSFAADVEKWTSFDGYQIRISPFVWKF